MPKACNLCGLPAFVLSNGSSLALFVGRVIYNYCRADEDSHSRELQEGTLDQNEYERRYADITEKYNTIKSEYDKILE